MPFFSFVKGRGILVLSGYRKRTLHFQHSLMVKCPLGCFLVYSSLSVASMRKSVCPNGDFSASPSLHAEIRQGCQLSDIFCVGIRDVFHCRRHKDYHVAQLDSGRIVGNKILLSPSCPMPLCKGSKLAQYSIRETFFIHLVSSCAVLFASKVVEKL